MGEGHDSGYEARDRSKIIWIVLVVAVVGMLGLLAMSSRPASKGPQVQSQVRVRHILVEMKGGSSADARMQAEALIDDLEARIKAGEDFGDLAREYSTDSHNAPNGGDMGYQLAGTFYPEFERAVWTQPIGEVFRLETSHGLHLVEVLDRRESDARQYRRNLHDETQRLIQEGAFDSETKPDGE
jgi:parvulin-like peptidyl-prolyl isomerase